MKYRKKPCLCIEDKSKAEIAVYGTFASDEAADIFMDKLGDFIGAERSRE